MAFLAILSMVAGLASVVCWVMTLITMAQDSEKGGVGHAIGGFFCGLYALIWGWQNRVKHNRENVMNVWVGATVAGVVLNAITTAMMS